jgi:hypothetical protein
MLDTELVPSTTVTAKGDSAAIDLSPASNPVLLATLEITNIIEQESLDVAIQASTDGTTWNLKPLASFPQQFYAGQYPLLVDLSHEPDAKFLRAHWEVNRWGRGTETPMFEFRVTLKEVPPDLLREVTATAHTRG